MPYTEESYWSEREANNDFGGDFAAGSPAVGSDGSGDGCGIRLSADQLARIEEAKREAGVGE
jgi:hypothetical protein